MNAPVLEHFIDDIKRLIEDARLNSYAAINAAMLETYWNIGNASLNRKQQGRASRIRDAVEEGAFSELSAAFGKVSRLGICEITGNSICLFRMLIWYTCTKFANRTFDHLFSLIAGYGRCGPHLVNEAAQETWASRIKYRRNEYYHRLLQSPAAKEKIDIGNEIPDRGV